MTNIAIFASGSGTNFEAIQRAIEEKIVPATISLVVCDVPGAKVIQKAMAKGINTLVLNAKDYTSKHEYESIIIKSCLQHKVEWLILAGYMRICGDTLLSHFPNRIINVHPSLLPAFKGKNAIEQAISYGVKIMGVSIHYVNQELDGGAIIAQEAFSLTENMTTEDIEKKIHTIEHQLYPSTLKKLLEESK